MDKKQSIEELQGELENLLDTVAELDRIMRDEEDDMFTYIAASAHKEMLDKRIKEIREYFYEDKVRNILKSIQSMQGVNFTKLMIPLLHKWRKNNLDKSELLEFCENRVRFWERFSIDSKLNNTPFPSIFRHTYKDWLKITSFVNHKFPNKLDNDYYEVCMERISKTVGFLNRWLSIRLIDAIISMDNIYNYVCSQFCSICKTNSDIDIYKSISRHGLYPIKDFDIIIEYLNIQDQLEQHMLGFISSANGKFFLIKEELKMKNKTFDEAGKALEATSEYKDYLEADKAEDEAWEELKMKNKAFDEAIEAFEKTYKAMAATPKYKAFEGACKAKDEAWEALKATSEWKALGGTPEWKALEEALKAKDEAWEKLNNEK